MYQLCQRIHILKLLSPQSNIQEHYQDREKIKYHSKPMNFTIFQKSITMRKKGLNNLIKKEELN